MRTSSGVEYYWTYHSVKYFYLIFFYFLNFFSYKWVEIGRELRLKIRNGVLEYMSLGKLRCFYFQRRIEFIRSIFTGIFRLHYKDVYFSSDCIYDGEWMAAKLAGTFSTIWGSSCRSETICSITDGLYYIKALNWKCNNFADHRGSGKAEWPLLFCPLIYRGHFEHVYRENSRLYCGRYEW